MSTAEEIGNKVLATLAAQAERNRQAGRERREQIAEATAGHAEHLTARQVRALLPRNPPSSLRVIQKHLKILRAQSLVVREPAADSGTHGQSEHSETL